jgi:hypothetical protein
MNRVFLFGNRVRVLSMLMYAGYLSARVVLDRFWGGVVTFWMLSTTLPALCVIVSRISWIRSLELPRWVVSFLPSIAMYFTVLHGGKSDPSVSTILIAAALCFIPGFVMWLVALSIVRQVELDR